VAVLTAVWHIGANTHCITSAEEKHLAEQTEGEVDTEKPQALEGDAKPRISVAA
jgi:anthranilate synthase component 1